MFVFIIFITVSIKNVTTCKMQMLRAIVGSAVYEEFFLVYSMKVVQFIVL